MVNKKQPNGGETVILLNRQLSFWHILILTIKICLMTNLHNFFLVKIKTCQKDILKEICENTQFNNLEMNLCMPDSSSDYLERYIIKLTPFD